MSVIRMPFGQFRGALLSELPTDYLEGLTTITLREPLRSAVESEVHLRQHERTRAPSSPSCDVTLARQIVDRGYKALAREHHPDGGGSVETMKKLNATASWLRDRLVVLT